MISTRPWREQERRGPHSDAGRTPTRTQREPSGAVMRPAPQEAQSAILRPAVGKDGSPTVINQKQRASSSSHIATRGRDGLIPWPCGSYHHPEAAWSVSPGSSLSPHLLLYHASYKSCSVEYSQGAVHSPPSLAVGQLHLFILRLDLKKLDDQTSPHKHRLADHGIAKNLKKNPKWWSGKAL